MSLSIPDLPPDVDGLTAALAYAECGWYVLPIKQGSKHPGSVVGFAWHTHSTRDPEQIAAWWAGADHGVALHAGRSGAVVLDVDHPDQLPRLITDALDETQPPMQTTRTTDTRRGHYIFAQPEGRSLGNGTGRLGGVWGEIRGLNGIIVVAPTRHAESDGAYAWQVTGNVPELSPQISEQLDDATPATDAAPDHEVAKFIMSYTATTRPDDLTAWVRLYRKKIAGGESRHDRMVSVLTGALKEARLGHYPAADAAAQLRQAFITAVTTEPLPGSGQGAARSEQSAAAEWSGILAWAVAQAETADLDEVETRHTEHSPAGEADLVALIGPTPSPPVAGSNALDPEPHTHADPATDPEDLPPTWRPIDLTTYLDGTHVPEEPALLPRQDGQCLVYAGRMHSMHGESESGKSLVAQYETARLIHAGRDVAYVDYESDPATITNRLVDMGCTPEAVGAHLSYIRPESSPYAVREFDEWKALLAGRFALVVLDGVTDALGTFGSSTKDNDEISTWIRMVARPLTRTGAAVVLIDHVVKNNDTRGRFALGGQSKMNALDGAAYVVEIAEPIGQGMRGEITLRVAKDRPGAVRPNSGKWRATDRTQEAAKIIVDSVDGNIAITVETPQNCVTDDSDGDDEKPFRATGIMEKISRLLEVAGEPMSRSRIVQTLKSDGVKARKETLLSAVAQLVEEGYLASSPAANGQPQPVSHVRVYRQKDDPTSDAYVAPFGDITGSYPQDETSYPQPVPTGSRPVPGTGGGDRFPVPPPRRGGTGAGTTRGEPHQSPPVPEPDDPEPRACRGCGEILGSGQLLVAGKCSRCIGRQP